MALNISRANGKHGQVEKVHTTFERTGKIYSNLPADASIDELENGMWLKYDEVAGRCNTTGLGDWLLVLNEVQLPEYDTPGHRQYPSDFVMKKDNFFSNRIDVRLVDLELGDKIITDQVPDGSYSVGDLLEPVSSNGNPAVLTKIEGSAEGKTNVWVVVKEFTLSDLTPALMVKKVQ